MVFGHLCGSSMALGCHLCQEVTTTGLQKSECPYYSICRVAGRLFA